MSAFFHEFWTITHPGANGEEIGMEGYGCPEPWDCHCIRVERESGPRRRCGYTLEEARREVVKYYRDKAAYFESASLTDFAQWMGYYESASGIETEGQDPTGLGAEHESPTAEGGDARA